MRRNMYFSRSLVEALLSADTRTGERRTENEVLNKRGPWSYHVPVLVADKSILSYTLGLATAADAQRTMCWAKGSLGQAYIEKNPLAALQAFAIASGWEQSSFMRRHFLGRALVRRIAKE